MITLDTLGFRHFGRKTKLFRSAGNFPLVLKLSTTCTLNDSILIMAVSLQLISLLLILSSKPPNVNLPRPICLSECCGRVTQPPPYVTHARDPTSGQFAKTFIGRRYCQHDILQGYEIMVMVNKIA